MTTFLDYLQNIFQFNEATQTLIIKFGLQVFIFLLFLILSLFIGRYTPFLVKIIIQKFSPKKVSEIYDNLITPIENLFKITGTFLLVSLSLNFLKAYPGIHGFIKFFVDFSLIGSLAWLISRLFRQFVRIYGIELIRKLGREADELLLVFETIFNVMVGFIAVIAFAQNQQINLVGLLASLGIGGLAIAFAAQKTLEQLLGTCVLYLDRPFIPGEYIRLPSGLFGRVESIGLRSTKIRTAAKSTLMIVPNSIMANLEIENVTRGKKVMVLLYLDFTKELEDSEQALVEQVVKESTDALFGIDPGSTKITLFPQESKPGIRARVTFFILGSSENSLELRKRLLELANDKITSQLMSYGIEFTVQEPTIYVESPVTI
ncbi:mechanosensitive ion channel domain-containing protein [Crocosphaera sp. UHCC 0190]|uniref:mechanosensitive ion channel family protein n=1 Tax=Crocosphaera sp. UHCC 0190 TaxID=3110246 RepID=UPI002B1F1D66|nr:mechanosensitive ion channel domain-containing protein [Crocosphaera sp. UHCC 0190]MEA5509208.1 mechanosensitive ion channel domain-containing protein [Crocosphaera sp. UHCC 0190]